MSAAGNGNNINEGGNANNIIFAIKELKLYVPVVTLSENDLKDQFIGMNIKQKVGIKYKK